MSHRRTEPIVIVGGGLAGASAACNLSRAGRSAVLIEREPEPRHKVCGEFLSVEAQACLTRLGLDLDRFGASRIAHLRLVLGADMVEVKLPFLARGLSRLVLDEALLQQASSHGIRIERGIAVRSIAPDGMGLRIDCGSSGDIDAETLFLATGKHDVRGLKRLPTGTIGDLIGFKMHYRLSPEERRGLDGAVEVALFPGGYAGLQMIENGTANLCLVVSRRHFEQAGRSWAALLDRIAGECPHLERRLESAAPSFERPLSIFQIPYGFLHSPQAGEPPGLFRLGDQAGVIPSFTGEGMAMALHSGCLAAAMFLRRGQAGAAFHRQLSGDIRHQIRLAFVLNKAARQELGQRSIFHLCRTWPSLMRHIASLTRLRDAAMQAAWVVP
ncbi:NAD(P)/FAD-dependent oxidoreductase [Microvirga arsenatis]|uniref:NAD-binding protein n=1 Tax=Microvirga arsenatis TaxID=2692265 RepID=A0ABW9YZW6_9HYPH|nr:FAD-dependent oxidoreductase [Microvirga arsenatis]NBJ12073.1 NAD-binding protein [Microvirga arsenatis]NBJ25936.1 NAD-binding protein [Microvirga arsenatis]